MAVTQNQGRDLNLWVAPTHGTEAPPLDDPLESYHEASSLYPSTMLGQGGPGAMLYAPTFNPERDLGKPTAPSGHDAIPLPAAAPVSGGLTSAIHARRSTTQLDPTRRLGMDHLAALLDHSYGLSDPQPPGAVQSARVAPSAGAMYPLDIFVLARRVTDLPEGIYHYNPFTRAVERVPTHRPVRELSRHTVMPELVDRAGAVFFITATLWRCRSKYGDRSYRYALLEAGHVAQNMLLVAVALRMSQVPWGGFFDRHFNRFLGLDGLAQIGLYAVSVDGLSQA
jgi:SagB-type dehydrogenase family enzyme